MSSASRAAALTARVRARAGELGFEAVGIARADVPLEADFARYEAFVDAGMHGEMSWLADDREVRRRLDGEAILAGAKSVICLARRYARDLPEGAPPIAEKIARYARGQDYHVFLRKKLRKLAAFVRTLDAEAPAEARPLLDVAPVLERAWAARAGLGFVGKNGLLIVPGQGSFVLLGEVVTTLELTPDTPLPERCGACTRCLDACPTGALVRPFVLDARRCVSYLTIEQRGATDPALREGVGEHLFGCDDCQTVCPFNAAAAPPASAPFRPREAWREVSLAGLLRLDVDAWARLAEGSPVHRATQEGMVRNASIVLGNMALRGAHVAPEEAEALRAVAADERRDEAARSAAAWALVQVEKHAERATC